MSAVQGPCVLKGQLQGLQHSQVVVHAQAVRVCCCEIARYQVISKILNGKDVIVCHLQEASSISLSDSRHLLCVKLT